jgi:hypothetical protein
MRIDPLRAGLLAACCLAAGSVTAASGQGTATPAPGCDGVHLVDKAKDNAQPTTDINKVWFDRLGGKTFANMQVSDLKTELPGDSTEWYWSVRYDAGDTTYLLVAFLQADGTQGFGYRSTLPAGGAYGPVEESQGTIFPGKAGVIRWELTDDMGGKVGTELVDTFASADEVVAGAPEKGSPYLRVVASIDDTTDIKSRPYMVKDACAGGTTPPPGGTPSGTPSGQPVAPPAQPTGPASPGGAKTEKLDVAVGKKVPRAKKVRRSLTLRAASKNGVSNVDAILVSGGKKGKVVGRGRIASLKGKGKLKLKISKKIKKGRYTLQLVGNNANGNGGSASFKLRFK